MTSQTSTKATDGVPSMRVYMTSEECWELNRHWTNAVTNGWYALMHDLRGWQARVFYWDWSGMVTIEHETDPFPSEVCPECHLRVKAGDVEAGTYYRQEDGYLCRLRLRMCSWCQSERGVMEGWPRGEDGRWLPSRDCEAVPA